MLDTHVKCFSVARPLRDGAERGRNYFAAISAAITLRAGIAMILRVFWTVADAASIASSFLHNILFESRRY